MGMFSDQRKIYPAMPAAAPKGARGGFNYRFSRAGNCPAVPREGPEAGRSHNFRQTITQLTIIFHAQIVLRKKFFNRPLRPGRNFSIAIQ